MVLECAFLQMVKGASHVPDQCWMRIFFFLSDRDVARVSATCSRLRHLVTAFRKAPPAEPSVARRKDSPAPLPAAAVAPAPAAVSAAAAKEEPAVEEKSGLFGRTAKSLRPSGSGGGFSLRKLVKK